MKKITSIIMLLLTFGLGYGQDCELFDDFNRSDNTLIGNGWTEVGGNSTITSSELEIVTGGASGRDYINRDISSVYSSQINTLTKVITWSFNMQQSRINPSGFDSLRYGLAFVIGGTDSDFTVGDGYAVVLGQSGATDNVRLVRYNGGLDLDSNLTDVITGSVDFGTEHLSVKVTYDSSTDTWELFVRNDGTSFADPKTITGADSQGTAIDATCTGDDLDFLGCVWNHATGVSETATFDNVFAGTITTWNGTSWDNGTPTSSDKVIIDGAYTTNATNGSFSACSLIVNAGNILIVDDGYYVEVLNDVTIEGDLTVENHGAFVQNDDNSSFSLVGAGSAVVAKSTAVLDQWYYYTYWSSPIDGLTISTSPLSDSDRIYWFNAANYLDDHTVGTTNGIPDDIDDNGDDWQDAFGSDTMEAGVGFAATHSQIGWIGARNYGYDFSGEFNNGVITTSISYNGANGDKDWNLIGNPYPCALDFDTFYAANSAVIDGAAYLWSHRSALSGANPGNQVLNFSQNDYVIITAGSGSINNADNGDGNVPNDYIPSGQGFFISGLSNGTVTFNNSMRIADGTSNSQFFKNTKEKKNVTKNRLWINLTSDNGVFNQLLVAYVDGATNGNDGMAYDAPRNLASGVSSIVYTMIDGDDKKYAIQGKGIHSLDKTETINLGFKTNIEVATLYKLSLALFQGDFITNNGVYLRDNLLNKVHNLSESDYTFTSEVGEFNDRFVIAFNNSVLSSEDALLDDGGLRIVDLGNDNVKFNVSNSLNINAIEIYDTLGRNLYTVSADSSSKIIKLSKLKSSIFIARVTLSNGVVITKKATKN